jgi:hypothetical protein
LRLLRDLRRSRARQYKKAQSLRFRKSFHPMISSQLLEDIFSLPSSDQADSASVPTIHFSEKTLSTCGKAFNAFKNRRNACKVIDAADQDDPLALFDRRSRCDASPENPVYRRTRSSSTHELSRFSQDECLNAVSHGRPTRATYNFHIGLLTHRESRLAHTGSCGDSERFPAQRSSYQAHEELWDLLLK